MAVQAGLINALSSSTQSGHPAFKALCEIANLSYSLVAAYYSLTPPPITVKKIRKSPTH